MADLSAEDEIVPLTSTQLAIERTRLGHERTLMAWIRTATSLISFGFTVYKFFQSLREENQIQHPDRIFGSREFALLMILAGLMALVIATLQHRRDMKNLRVQYVETPYSLATGIAVLIAGLGLLGLFVVIFRQ